MTRSYNAALFRLEITNIFQITVLEQRAEVVETPRINSISLALNEIRDLYAEQY